MGTGDFNVGVVWSGQSMVELLLDPAIRLWVILPIILITLMVGLVRHYITILLKSDRAPDLKELRDR